MGASYNSRPSATSFSAWLAKKGVIRDKISLLAGFIFALGPGHNIPFIGGTIGVVKELTIIAAVITASALVLVQVQAWLSGQAPRGRRPSVDVPRDHVSEYRS